MTEAIDRGVRSAQLGILVNTLLAAVKLVAGLVGNAYALVADAVESTADVLSSTIVWGGLRVAARDPDDAYPFGYGKRSRSPPRSSRSCCSARPSASRWRRSARSARRTTRRPRGRSACSSASCS